MLHTTHNIPTFDVPGRVLSSYNEPQAPERRAHEVVDSLLADVRAPFMSPRREPPAPSPAAYTSLHDAVNKTVRFTDAEQTKAFVDVGAEGRFYNAPPPADAQPLKSCLNPASLRPTLERRKEATVPRTFAAPAKEAVVPTRLSKTHSTLVALAAAAVGGALGPATLGASPALAASASFGVAFVAARTNCRLFLYMAGIAMGAVVGAALAIQAAPCVATVGLAAAAVVGGVLGYQIVQHRRGVATAMLALAATGATLWAVSIVGPRLGFGVLSFQFAA